MQGKSFQTNKGLGSFRSWIENELDDIKYYLIIKAREFISEHAESYFDGDLKLNTGRWSYLSSKNKKEGYKGYETLDNNGIPVVKLTFNSFKHGGYTESFDSYKALKELWDLKKSGSVTSINKIIDKERKISKNELEDDINLKQIINDEFNLWESLNRAGESEYLAKKKLTNIIGIRFDKSFIAVKLINTKREFCGLQKIYNSGTKFFTKGLNKKGNFAVIGLETLPEHLERIHICEGVATAASIHLATLEPVIAAMDAFNLEPVTYRLKKKYPKSQFIIWADNDQWNAHNLDKNGNAIGNTGLIQANYTALKENALVMCPNFDSIKDVAKDKLLTDFNDLYIHRGIDALITTVPQKADINLALEKKIKIQQKLNHGLLSVSQVKNGHKHVINSRFIPETTINDGITLIRSPIGTGKTQLVEKYLSQNKQASVVFITHLISLIEDASSRLNLKSYSECDNFDLQMQKRLAICLNSLGKLVIEGDLPHYDVLIIDEIEQVLNRMCSKLDQKNLIFNILERLITNSKVVICLDAHLSDTTMGIIKRWSGGKNISVIFNEYKVGEGRNIVLYENKESLQLKALQELQRNNNAYLTFNSKNEARKTYYLIKKFFREKKGLFISSDNNGDQDVKDFFGNVNEESKKYDYIICTPSVSTGVSITNNHFQFVGGFFKSDINTPNDCMQAIGRVRNSSEINIYVEKRKDNRTLDPRIIALKWTETHQYDMNLMGLSCEGERIVICPDYEFLRTNITLNRNRGLNNFYYEFCLLNKLDGYTVTHSDFILNESVKSEIRDIKSYYSKDEHLKDILDAVNIDSKLASIIEYKSRKKMDETLSFEKHKLIEFYNLNKYNPQEIQDFFLLDDSTKLRSKVLNLELALSTREYAVNLHTKQMEKSEQFRADLKHYATIQELYRRLLLELKILTKEGHISTHLFSKDSFIYNKDSLVNGDFFGWVKKHHSIISGAINIQDIDKIMLEPLRFVSKLLSNLGLKQKRCGKNELNNYSIETESVEFMKSLLNKRNFFKGDTSEIVMIKEADSVPDTTVPMYACQDVINKFMYVGNSYRKQFNNKLEESIKVSTELNKLSFVHRFLKDTYLGVCDDIYQTV